MGPVSPWFLKRPRAERPGPPAIGALSHRFFFGWEGSLLK